MEISIIKGWKNIGKYGYAHHTGECLLDDEHTLKIVEDSISRTWHGYCRCGEWKGVAYPDESMSNDAVAALRAAHTEHAQAMAVGGYGVWTLCWQDLNNPSTYDFRISSERFTSETEARIYGERIASSHLGDIWISSFDVPPSRELLPKARPKDHRISLVDQAGVESLIPKSFISGAN